MPFPRRNVLSTWSSGTGGAGIVGAFSYAFLIAMGLSNRDTLLIMISFPTLQACAFWLILRSPTDEPEPEQEDEEEPAKIIESTVCNLSAKDSSKASLSPIKLEVGVIDRMSDSDQALDGFKAKLKYMPSLFKYIGPLILVFLFEYIINSGLVSKPTFDF